MNWLSSSASCAVSTSWPPRFPSRRRGWRRVRPNGMSSRRAPGMTLRDFRGLPERGVTADLFAESEGGAQSARFIGGTSEIPRRLAAVIAGHIVLDVPVQLIEHTADSVTVHCRGGLVARGRRVIVAVSPTLAGRIMYDPPLSGVHDQLTQRLPNGSAMKAFVVYDEPFWRTDGFNGQLISDIGPARMSNDTCLPGDDHGVILLFLEGPHLRPASPRRAQDSADRRAGSPLRQQGRAPGVLRRRGMVGPAVDPWVLQRGSRPTRVDYVRPRIGAPTWRARSRRENVPRWRSSRPFPSGWCTSR